LTLPAAETSRVVQEQAPASEGSTTPNWTTSPETPWEVEAKKASLLASTWDLPAHVPSSAELAPVAEAEKLLAQEPVSEPASPYAAEDSSRGHQEFVAERKETDSLANGSAYSSTELLTGNETQEVPVYSENSSYTSAPLEEFAAGEATEPAQAAEAAEDLAASGQPAAESETAATPSQPNMDELVESVLAKMNPEVLQKVAQGILRPVIEELIKNEFNVKK